MKKFIIIALLIAIPVCGAICFATGYFGYNYLTSDKTEKEDEKDTGEQEDEKTKEDEDDETTTDTETLYNQEYGFTINVGDTTKYTVVEDDYEWAETWYMYCYTLTEETDYEDATCGTGSVGLFGIGVYNESQYEEIQMYTDVYPLLGQKDGLYFILEWPGGVLPEEVEDEYDIYDTVEQSFTFDEP